MPPVPLLRPAEVVKAFEKLGWSIARQQGSHIILTKSGHSATLSVPKHDRVARGTLRSLIGQANITIEEFLRVVSK